MIYRPNMGSGVENINNIAIWPLRLLTIWQPRGILDIWAIYVSEITKITKKQSIIYLLLWPLSVLGAIATQDLFVES